MPHYLIRYSIGANNAYVYPESVAGVVWKLAIYHYTEPVMVGETDATLEADGRQVASLSSDEANKLIEQYQASYPKPGDIPDPLRLPPA
jgi:hypothetical protein